MNLVKNDKIKPMLDYLLNNENVSQSSKFGFLTSLSSFFNRQNGLSENQYMALERMYQSYSVDHSEWRNNFDDDKKNTFKLCVEFYSRSKYYSNIIDKVKKDSNYIPSEKEYKALCENKYAVVFLREYHTPPKFGLGDMVRVRKNNTMGIGNILEVIPGLTVAVRGGKMYRVYFASSGQSHNMQERLLANVRDCDLNKMSETTIGVDSY